MEYKVFQVTINNDRYFEVNAFGWDGVDWGKAYSALALVSYNDEDIADKIFDAVDHNLYEHNIIIEADNLEHMFTIGNYISDQGNIKWSDPQRSSVSVGNVVIANGHMYICATTGWIQLTDEDCHKFESKVTQIMLRAA